MKQSSGTVSKGCLMVSVNLGGASPMDALPWVGCACVTRCLVGQE